MPRLVDGGRGVLLTVGLRHCGLESVLEFHGVPEVSVAFHVFGDHRGGRFRAPGRPAQAEYQMVPGPGGCHVHDADVLGRRHPIVVFSQLFETGRGKTLVGRANTHLDPAGRPIHDDLVAGSRRSGVEAGENYHGELQSFGAVDGHHPHRLFIRLRHGSLGDASAFVDLVVHPPQEIAQRPSAGAAEQRRLLHQETVTAPLLPHPDLTGGRLQQPAIADKPVDQRAG